MRARAAAVLAVLSFGLPSASAAQGSSQQGALTGVVVATRTDAEQREALLVKVPAQVSGRAVDEIRLRVGREAARAADAALLPDGWTARAASDELRLTGPARPGTADLIARFVATGASRAVMAALTQARLELFAGGDRLMRAEVPVDRRAPLDADLPLDSVIGLPPVITAGETITMKPYDLSLTPLGGSWTFTPLDPAGAEPDVSPPAADPAAPGNAPAEYSFDLSVGTSFTGAGLKLGVKYTDEYGDVILDAEPPTLTLLPEPAGEGASISGCTTKSFRGRVICVCGYFPDEAARSRLTIDGTPLGAPQTSSKRVLFFRLPEAIGPGTYTIALTGAAGTASVEVLELSGQIDQKELLRGQSTPIHIRIAGTRDPLSLRLVNHSPGIITLDGGNDQVIQTSGGDANSYSGMVRGHTPGDFRLTYELTAGRCPCADLNETTDGLPDGETWYDDTRERFRRGRDLANDARDADLNGDDRARELAAEARAELERARAALKNGVASGDIGPESAKLFEEYITAYESQVRIVSTPPPAVPIPPPPADDPRDAPPPVIYGEEIDTPEIVVTDGWFQPSQGVWQDDRSFEDKPGKRLTRTGAATWHAELKMVAGRATALFGIRDDRGFTHERIHLKGETTATVAVPVHFRFTLVQGGRRTVVYEQPASDSRLLPIDGPSGPRREWEVSLFSSDGVPNPGTFTFAAGPYVLEAELIRNDTGAATGLKAIVSGEAVVTTAPPLQFVPVALGETGRAGQSVLARKARALATEVASRLPQFLPVADGGITTSAHPLQQFPQVQPGVLRELISMLPLADDSDTVRRDRLVAAMTNWLGTQAALAGGGKVVAILQRDEFDSLWPEDDAVAFAASQKLMVATNDAYVDTIGHELVHTSPYLWSRNEMTAAFGFSYHNNDDRQYGDGTALFPLRTRHKQVVSMMGPAAGPPWVTQGTYWHMLEQFLAAPDPPLIVTRGFLARVDGRLHGRLDALYELMGVPDLEPGELGPDAVAIELRDGGGAVLGRFPFRLDWRMPHVEGERALVAFTYTVPDLPGAVEIALVGPDGAVLHSRRRTANSPAVDIVSPAGGARIAPQDGRLRVTWRATDADGDALTYMVLYSADDGATWRVAGYEIGETSFDVPVTGRPRAARIRVIATDGARSGQAEVAFTFQR